MSGLLLHGFLGSPDDWQPTLEALPAATRQQICCLALPGHHGAAPPAGDDFAACLSALAARLPAAAPRQTLVGYSLGARLALGLAARQPQRWTRIVLIGVHPGLGDPALRQQRRHSDARWAATFRQPPLSAALQAWSAQPLFDSQRLPGRVPEARLAATQQRRLQLDGAAVAATLQAASLGNMPDYTPILRQLGARLRLVVGAQDAAFLRLARSLPVADLQIIPACGHSPLLEAPGALAALLQPDL